VSNPAVMKTTSLLPAPYSYEPICSESNYALELEPETENEQWSWQTHRHIIVSYVGRYNT